MSFEGGRPLTVCMRFLLTFLVKAGKAALPCRCYVKQTTTWH